MREAFALRQSAMMRRSNEPLFDFFDQSPVGVARIQESDGRVVDVNQELCRMLGLGRKELEDASAQFLVDMVEPAQRKNPHARKSEPFLLHRPDGNMVRVVLSATRYEDDDGWYTLLIFNDVTEREQLRQQVLLGERMTSLGMLAAGVAHEINNPLGYAMNNLHFLGELLREGAAQKAPLSEKAELEMAREAIRDALDGCTRVRDIVQQLRDFSRSDDTALELVSVEQVIQRALSFVSHDIRHRACVKLDFGGAGDISTNPGKLGQVIVNLLINASQAIEGRAADNEITLRTRRIGDEVQIEVSDTGQGIAAENLQRIFEPFFTTKPLGVGTGLGLSVCHAIVTSLGGRIEASSSGRGASFRVTLPATTAEATRPKTEAQAPAAEARRGRILIVDDEPGLGRALSRIFATSHDVVAVTSGREALDLLARNERFDLVLCDIMMPDTNGIDLFRQIQAQHPELTDNVVFITGGAFTPSARSFLESVSNERLLKPLDIPTLRRIVSDRIGLH